ncbi:MAG: glycosyltransferase family 39 protein [Candidatus Daviesbacteria bacterium]|nr:glycosyltransferase family 39 protein [Candidatus Daviesbacteria bacterium]
MKLNKFKILLTLVLLLATFLRFYRIDENPVSLFGDELDVGYQAYSILKTGRDYMGNFLPIHFQSLAEYRTPLYIYSAVPTVAVFGISALGVRLPAAVFGVLSVLALYLLVLEITKNKKLGLLAAFLLSISPWHTHFSRAGFEVTEMLFFYITGIYFFLHGLKSGKWLFLSAICLGLTPWVYSTAKLFLPLTVLAILVIWWKDLLNIPKRRLFLAITIFVIIVVPFLTSTIFGGGAERIQGISIFNNPTVIPQMGFDRMNDVNVRGENQSVTIVDKLFHNKITAYSAIFINNYFQSFSPEFLFTKGDYLNLRQSSGIEFYKVELIFLILGLIYLVTSGLDRKVKAFLIFWLLVAPIPSSLTQGGGNHATRLILMLPILIILIAFGMYYSYTKISRKLKVVFLVLVSIILFLNFIFYQHNYWVHYPWSSERWWHAGYEEAIKSAVKIGGNYDRVIISSANEPSLKFFLGWSMYPPERFQKEYNADSTLHLGKYEFPPVGAGLNLYEIGSKLPEGVLYLATIKEIVLDLNKEPGRVPNDIKLIKIINYPSGAPAFYLFEKAI